MKEAARLLRTKIRDLALPCCAMRKLAMPAQRRA